MSGVEQNPASWLTLADAANLPPTLDVPTAAKLLGIGRSVAYQLAATDALPVPVIRIGHAVRIPTAPVLRLLGLTDPEPEPGPVRGRDGGPDPAGDGTGGRTVARSRDARSDPWTAPGPASVHGNPGPAE